MSDQEKIAAVVRVLERAWDEGSPIARPSEEMAAVAVRRYESSPRRGINAADRHARVRDLAGGLIAFHGQSVAGVGPLKRDYEYVADLILAELDAAMS